MAKLTPEQEDQVKQVEALVASVENPAFAAAPQPGITPDQLMGIIALAKLVLDLFRRK